MRTSPSEQFPTTANRPSSSSSSTVFFLLEAREREEEGTNEEGQGAAVEERGGARAMLTFTVDGRRDVEAALEASCALAGPTGCFGKSGTF